MKSQGDHLKTYNQKNKKWHPNQSMRKWKNERRRQRACGPRKIDVGKLPWAKSLNKTGHGPSKSNRPYCIDIHPAACATIIDTDTRNQKPRVAQLQKSKNLPRQFNSRNRHTNIYRVPTENSSSPTYSSLIGKGVATVLGGFTPCIDPFFCTVACTRPNSIWKPTAANSTNKSRNGQLDTQRQ